MRMSTWLNIADCVLWMARCRSFWGDRAGLPPAHTAWGHQLLPCSALPSEGQAWI